MQPQQTSHHQRWQELWALRPGQIRVAKRAGLTEADAEDVMHDAMLAVLNREAVVGEAIAPYLTTVTKNLARRRAVVASRHLPLSEMDDLPGPVHQPHDAIVDRAAAVWADRQLETLPPGQQRVLRLRAEGLSVSDIALHMSLTPKSVEGLLKRGRSAAKTMLVGALSWAVAASSAGRRSVVLGSAAVASVTLLMLPRVEGGQQAPPPSPALSRASVKMAVSSN